VIIFSLIIAFGLLHLSKAFALVSKIEKTMRYIVASIFMIIGIYYLQFLFKFLADRAL
jgi:hypothetical protein